MASGNGTPRTFTISTETATGVVNPTLLTAEIEANGTILTTLSYITTTGDVMDIYFVSALSGAEQTALDTVVSNHQGTITTSNWQKWESNTIQSTSTQSFQNVLQRTANAVAAGTYRLSWHWELKLTPTGPINSRGQARFSVNTGGGPSYLGITNTTSDDWQQSSGWDFITFAEGDVPVLQVEFQVDPAVGGNDTVDIRRVKMSIELMPE